MELGIEGRRALVGGGSRGIGYAVASRLLKEGCDVTIAAQCQVSLSKAADRLYAESGRRVSTVAADVTTVEGRRAMIAACAEPDILLAHNGISQRFARFEELSRDDWNRWFEAHFFSAVDLIQAVLPGMQARRFGRIVCLSVNFIKFPQRNAAHTHAARLALAGALTSISKQAAPFNVTLNSVLPGPIQTDALVAALTERARGRGVAYRDIEEEMLATVPASRVAEAQEVGDLIAMLCAAQMGYVTAQNISVDGGQCPCLF